MDRNTFIAVVTYNSEDFIEHCLSSIVDSDYKNWFLAVIDNCSKDFTVEKILSFRARKNEAVLQLDENNFRFLESKKNIGFAGAVNHLVFEFLFKENSGLAAQIKYLVLINPDVILEKHSLRNLVMPFKPGLQQKSYKAGNGSSTGDAKIGAVGGLIYDWDQYSSHSISQGNIQNAGGKVRNNFITYHLDWPIQGKTFYQVDYVSGSVFATRLDYFKKISGFDTGYRPLYFEELDYCLKLKKLGLLPYINTEVVARHYEGASVKKFSRDFYRHYHKNRIRCAIINCGVKYFFKKFLPSESKWLKNMVSRDQYLAVLAAYFLNFFFLSYNLIVKLKNYIIMRNFSKPVLKIE